VEYEGAIYHVMVRGNNRRKLFYDDKDRCRFLIRLKEMAEEFRVRVYAFCLMSNHVHLVIETPHANLGRFMQKLQTAYTIYFNLRHGESGHVMQGRYKAKPVEGDKYLMGLARYVHLNPVYVSPVDKLELAERIRQLRQYRWSSYPRYLGQREWSFVDEGPLLAMMGGRSKARRRAEFRRYVEGAIAEPDAEIIEAMTWSPLGIGGEEFRDRILTLYEQLTQKRNKPEDVSLRREGRWLAAEEIVGICCRHLGVEPSAIRERRRKKWVRAVTAWELGRYAGMTQREIAAMFWVATGKAVGVQQENVRRGIQEDRKLAKLISAIEIEIEKKKSEQ
jgi:REP element-mobilizing transposase RayT